MHEPSEHFDKEIENIKSNQSVLKNTRMKIKNTLEGINSRLEDAEQIKDTVMESN